MSAPARVLARAARAIHGVVRRRHPSARAGYDAAMAATFDALLAQAEASGAWAVIRLAASEIFGLLATARARSGAAPQPAAAYGRPGAAHGLPIPKGRSTMDTIGQDLRFALRSFTRRPGFTAAVVATLALGIGANTAIFSVVNAVLFQQLPFADPDRLVMVWEDASSLGFPRNTPAPGNYSAWASQIGAFDGVAALDRQDFNLVGDGEPEKLSGAAASANLFTVLGVQPVIGRTWRPDEDAPGIRVAVISHALWMRRFGGDPGILNRPIRLNGFSYAVLGVMPPRFQTVQPDVHLWVPANFTTEQLADYGSHYLWVVARLRDGVALAQANAELDALASRLQREQTQTNRGVGMYAVTLLDDYVGDTRAVLVVLLAAVGCVLLVASANVANLLLTRATGRAREMAVRAALGADRRRLMQQGLTESLMLAGAGGALGLGVAWASFATLTRLVPARLADLSRVGLDPGVLGATTLVTAATGVLFGLAPAWRASRADLVAAGGRLTSRGSTSGPTRLGRALVVVEVALASVLLVGAGLLVESFQSIRGVNLGFRPAQVLTARVQLPPSAYREGARRTQFVADVLDRVRALPGVEMAGYTSAVPLVWKGGSSGFRPEDQPRDPSLPYDALNRTVSPGYMETVGMTLRAGRFFDARDDLNGEPVAIINARMAQQYWPGVEPLVGRRFRAGSEGSAAPWRTIVGIVDSTSTMGVDQPTKAEMFFPIAQSPTNWMWPRDLAVRVAGDPMAIAPAIRRIVSEVDRSQPVSDIETLEAIVARELQSRRLQMTLMSAFAALALLLASVGVYGVLSYAVTSRTSEIGLRLALGGDPARIRRLVVGQGLRLAGLGLGLGLAAAYFGATLMSRILFQVSPRDPGTFAVQAVVLAAACGLAAYLPARRASRVDPVTALRME
jgi:putative ABC transport system permease protein